MTRSYHDYCRPAHQIERTAKCPGDLVLNGNSIERIERCRRAASDPGEVAGHAVLLKTERLAGFVS